MVSLFIISLFTSFVLCAEESASVYYKQDLNTSGNHTEDGNQIIAYMGESGMNAEEYFVSLQKVLSHFEEDHLLRIEPREYPKIAIKLETSFAPGLQTSVHLIDALLESLKRRGYKKSDILLFDRNLEGLQEAGFILQSGKDNYKGHQVISSSDNEYFMEGWFHDSPLPPTSFDRAKFILKFPSNPSKRFLEERKSYLPAPIFKDAYWINLAVPMDDVFLGIDGAAANLSLGAMSNYGRFQLKKTMAPATVAEIMAIPEIWDKRLFSILDFSRYQVANGQRFDSKYTEKEPNFLLSRNPFSIDYLAWNIINKKRSTRGLSVRLEDQSLLFKYAEELGLGVPRKTRLKIISK